jgi:hypothetical protein
MIRLVLFVAAILLCAWYAFRAGGQPERAAITAQLAALLLTFFSAFLLSFGSLAAPVWSWLATDVSLLAVLTAMALRANRLWTLVLAGLQLASIFAHLTKVLFPDHLSPLAYAVLLQVWGWPMLATTAMGIRHHQLRQRRGVLQPDWKPTIHGWGEKAAS